MNDHDIIVTVETRISIILDELTQLAQILQDCKDNRGWSNFSDTVSG
ncbi:MAG: hypothetical protein ACOYJ1_01970 [Peptococcales bacterium]|jgi:hypothetical protein